jgi:hypothetical protein
MNDARNLEGGFRYTPRTYALRSVIEGVREREIIIDPHYRYHRAWPKSLKVKLIESVLLGIPVPEIWCEENRYGDIFVLEGAHILECLIDFLDNEFRLTGAWAIPDLEGCFYDDLPSKYSNAFVNRTTLDVRIISYDTAPLLKYEFFKLLNLEKRDFIPQVARNYAYPDLGNFLRQLTDDCDSMVTFQKRDNPYTQASFKRPFEVDRVFLLVIAMILLKRGLLEPVRGDIEALLDEAMFFLYDNPDSRRSLSSAVKHCLGRITNNGRTPLWVYFGVNKIQNSREVLDDSINVDMLLYACVDVLNERPVNNNRRAFNSSGYLKQPTNRRLYNDLL